MQENTYLTHMELPAEPNERERQIIYGTMMGDAYIHVKRPEMNNISLMMSRQVAHMEYMDWFMSELSRFSPTLKIYTRTDTHMTRYMGDHVRVQVTCEPYISESAILRTSTRTPFWKYLLNQFYGDASKKQFIPVEELTPLALAVLWQDDGATNSSYYAYGRLNVQGFPLAEREKLQLYLEDTYDITTKIIKTGELGFGKKSLNRLSDIIKPHMLPMFYYKLGMHNEDART